MTALMPMMVAVVDPCRSTTNLDARRRLRPRAPPDGLRELHPADARENQALARMNVELKGRAMWRPVAPSVLAEHWDAIFAGPIQPPASFMLAAYPVRADAQRLIPACVHVDGSARPQAVSASDNQLYWEIIDQFRQLTGVPALVNTSFNLSDEPIGHTMEDAIATFLRSSIDTLVIGSIILEKPSAPG